MAKRILILEDEKDIGRIYVKFLKEHGYDPVHASDGLEGIRLLKEVKPDLILLDLGMPNMNGIEFYQYICDNHGKPRYPVLVLTGRTDLEMLFKEFQTEGLIVKPFKQAQLLNEIDSIFNKQDQKFKAEHAKKIIIVDNDDNSSKGIEITLAGAGYRTEVINNGMMAIEKIIEEPPDMAVVSLNLPDLTGDLVILRLQGMTKTKHIKYLLYVPENYTIDKMVSAQFSSKSGIKLMCEYANPKEILDSVNKIFEESAQSI